MKEYRRSPFGCTWQYKRYVNPVLPTGEANSDRHMSPASEAQTNLHLTYWLELSTEDTWLLSVLLQQLLISSSSEW